jgi:hypothetical protein
MSYDEKLWDEFLLDDVYNQIYPNLRCILQTYVDMHKILGYGELCLPACYDNPFITHNLKCLIKKHPRCEDLLNSQRYNEDTKNELIHRITLKLIGSYLIELAEQ